MTDEELIVHYPRLFHLAAAGAWPAIRDHGLRTTRQLVEESTAGPELRRALLGARRAESVVVEHPVLGTAVVRDQGPLFERNLRLTDMTPAEWLDVLNGRVFFWLHPGRLARLRRARRYGALAHDVLTLDTASLLARHRDRVRLSGLNSGATLFPNAPPRGSHTFSTVDAQPWPVRPRRSAADALVELAVIDGVPDVDGHVVRVERWEPDAPPVVLVDRGRR